MENFIIFGAFFVIFISIAFVGFLKFKRNIRQKNNASAIFSRNSAESVKIINSFENPILLTDYLNALLKNEAEKNVVIETAEYKNNTFLKKGLSFLKFDNEYEKIEILSNPDSLNTAPETVSYSDVGKVFLQFRSYSETRGSGKSSRTYYYNQYWVTLRINAGNSFRDIFVYNNTTYVSQDNGLYETQARAVGETLAKIFKVNLVRTDGSETEYDKLDESVVHKLRDFVRSNYSFKQEPFLTQEIDGGYCINELKYMNIPKLVLGIIFISIFDIIAIVLFVSSNILGREANPFYIFGAIVLVEILCAVLIALWVNLSKNKQPMLKPIL
ncbi:MAG TPA: hypothetical protein PLO89_08195, partial [Spirochaetota bacterium]|nr:hypothetical protein [Spirochaetota bacterium]